jgi:hypothetical protein
MTKREGCRWPTSRATSVTFSGGWASSSALRSRTERRCAEGREADLIVGALEPARRDRQRMSERREGQWPAVPALNGLWGAQTRSGSRGRAVFVNQPTETIPSANAERMGRSN